MKSRSLNLKIIRYIPLVYNIFITSFYLDILKLYFILIQMLYVYVMSTITSKVNKLKLSILPKKK